MWIVDEETGERIEDNDRAVRQSIQRRLTTYVGTRPGRPDYQVTLDDYIDERLTVRIVAEIVYQVTEALRDLVEVDEVSVGRDRDEKAIILVINGQYQVIIS